MYLLTDLSSTETVVSKLLAGFLFDLRCFEIDGDDDDDGVEMAWCDMIFIYCSWISTRWQWSVNFRKNGSQHKKRNNTQHNTVIENREQKYKTKNKQKEH